MRVGWSVWFMRIRREVRGIAECSSDGLERCIRVAEVVGSSPAIPTKN